MPGETIMSRLIDQNLRHNISSQPTRTLAATLKGLRHDRRMTIYQLGSIATVPASLISGLENGSRTIGENNATKIGKALGLSGHELEQFVYLALNEAAGKVLSEFQPYPAEVLNLVATELKKTGIGPESVNRCSIHNALTKTPNGRASLTLNNGSTVLIKVEVTRE